MNNYKKFEILTKLSEINEPYISATDIFKSKEIQDILLFEDLDDYYISKEKNYIKDTYFHINTNNSKENQYAGVGNGLYLGRDKIALKRFYDLDNYNFSISEYHIKPKWFNMMLIETNKKVISLFKKYDIEIINSDEVGKIFMKLGFDGIRYYDIYATGEEFVLFKKLY